MKNNVPENIQVLPYFKISNSILTKNDGDLPQTQSTANYFSQIFRSPFGLITWFFGLKWYVIIFIVIFGLFLFFQVESAIEARKNARNSKKSEKVETMKGILRDTEKTDISKKNVSFEEHREPMTSQITETSEIQSQQLYDLWIRPFLYTTFRSFIK